MRVCTYSKLRLVVECIESETEIDEKREKNEKKAKKKEKSKKQKAKRNTFNEINRKSRFEIAKIVAFSNTPSKP